MNKTELESKHLAELHALAAEAGVERYRMLARPELIEALADGGGSAAGGGAEGARESRQRRDSGSTRERRPRKRERPPRGETRGRPAQGEKPKTPERQSEAKVPTPADASAERPKRRRRRRFGRRARKTIRVQDVLLPASPGGQVLVYGETRAACTTLLRDLAAELSGAARGPDPVALLVDPSPEELADWKREAPKAEIVSAGQERHAEDALAQAARRAQSGEAVIVLIDSLSRAAEEFGGSKTAKELFDAGRAAGSAAGGSLTIVAALERAGE